MILRNFLSIKLRCTINRYYADVLVVLHASRSVSFRFVVLFLHVYRPCTILPVWVRAYDPRSYRQRRTRSYGCLLFTMIFSFPPSFPLFTCVSIRRHADIRLQIFARYLVNKRDPSISRKSIILASTFFNARGVRACWTPLNDVRSTVVERENVVQSQRPKFIKRDRPFVIIAIFIIIRFIRSVCMCISDRVNIHR